MTPSTSAGAWREVGEVELTPILLGALDAFSESGYHGTTVRDIAARVGVTVPALYYHHPNKEAILLALLNLATEDIGWRVEEAIAEAGDDVRLALGNIVEAVVIHMTHRLKLALLDAEARYLSPQNRPAYALPRRKIETSVTAVIQHGVSTGVFTTSQPREASRALLGMLQWITRWYRPEGALSPSDVSAKYMVLALDLVGEGRQSSPAVY